MLRKKVILFIEVQCPANLRQLSQIDSHLLQLCDILIGGIRVHSYCPFVNKTKYRVSKKCRDLLEHDQDNFARMNNSRYCKGFLLNEAWIEDGEWNFGQINVAKNIKHKQQVLDMNFK